MENRRNLKGYWTKERCLEEALKYEGRTEFSKMSSNAYRSSIRNHWIDECCKHMSIKIKPDNYWTIVLCKNMALKCKSREEFKNKYCAAYSFAYKKGWLDECCKHMIKITKPRGYWTKERCLDVALKCKSRTEFITNYSSAYSAAFRNGWINECHQHMKMLGNLYNRMIYVILFSNNHNLILR